MLMPLLPAMASRGHGHCSFPIVQDLSLKQAMKAYNSRSYWAPHYSLWLGRIPLFSQMLYVLRIRNHFYVIKSYHSSGSILCLLVEENLWHWTWQKPSFSQAPIKQVLSVSPPPTKGSRMWRIPNWKEGIVGFRLKQIRANQGNPVCYKTSELCNFNLDVRKKLYHALYSFLDNCLNTASFFLRRWEGNRVLRKTRTTRLC